MSFISDFLFGEKQKPISQGHIVGQFPTSLEHILGGVPEEGFTTGFSTLNPRTGALSADPLGRNLNLEGLSNFATSLGQQRESLLGNQGAFQQARVNPLVEQLAAGRGQLERNLGRTGVRGTFGNQAIQSYDIGAQRALGDARALATQETQGALNQLSTQLFEGQTGVGTNIFNQELEGLKLSSATLQNLLSIASNLTTGAGSSAVSSANAASQANQARAGDQRSFLGSLLFGGAGFGGLI